MEKRTRFVVGNRLIWSTRALTVANLEPFIEGLRPSTSVLKTLLAGSTAGFFSSKT